MTVSPMANQAANGDLESGSTTGWTARNSGTLSINGTQAHQGSHSLQVDRSNVNSSAGNTVSLDPGIYYNISVWVKLDSGTSNAKLMLDAGTPVTLDAKAIGTDWVQLSGEYKSTAASTPAIYVEFASGTTTYYVDDLVVD